MIVRRQRVAFVMIQPVAVCAHARHENVTVQIISAGPRRRFHLRGRGAVLPVVYVVEHNIEVPACQRPLHCLGIVAVRHNVADLFSQLMAWFSMQNGDVVAGVKQLLHQRLADKQSAADHQHFSLGRLLALGSVSRSTRAQGV